MTVIDKKSMSSLLLESALKEHEIITVDQLIESLKESALCTLHTDIYKAYLLFRDTYVVEHDIKRPGDKALATAAKIWIGTIYSVEEIAHGFIATSELLSMVDDKELADAFKEHCLNRIEVPKNRLALQRWTTDDELSLWYDIGISDEQKDKLPLYRLKYEKLAKERVTALLRGYKIKSVELQDKLDSKDKEYKERREYYVQLYGTKKSKSEDNSLVVDDLTAQLMEANRRVDFYKAALYDRGIIDSDGNIEELCEPLLEEEKTDIDLSKYKIFVVTSASHANAFKYEYVDIDKDPKRVNKLSRADVVIIDTKHISHHTYYSTRTMCQNNGIKILHYGRRDPKILDEMLRRILSK